MTPAATKSSAKPTSTRILVGGAGAPNYGDELIVKGWMDLFAENDDQGERVCFQENSGDTCRKFHMRAGNPFGHRVVFQDALTNIAKAQSGLTFWQQVERGHNFMRDFGFREHGYKNTSDFFASSSYHLHGGGYLTDALFNGHRPDKGFLLGFGASLKKLYGVSAYATGIGFGPFDDPCPDPSFFAEILSYYDFFETRDAESHALLTSFASSAKIVNGLDDCFILPVGKIHTPDSTQRRLHLSIINAHCPAAEDPFWQWLAREAAAFDEVVFWTSYPWDDREPIGRVTAVVPECKVHSAHDLVYKLPPVGDGDVFLTHRFHVHFAAARAGARGFYLSPTDYYRQKHQSIVALGSGLLPLDMNDLPGLGDLPAVSALDEPALRGQKLRVLDSLNYNVAASFLS